MLSVRKHFLIILHLLQGLKIILSLESQAGKAKCEFMGVKMATFK